MSRKGKVLVAMSGGLDSSVAAILLRDSGYDVVGATMKVWDYESTNSPKRETACCSIDSINDARLVAVKIGFPHFVFDLRNEFEKQVISNFTSEYMSGRTPNPCVLCNTFIKWNALLLKADQLGCDFIATGHYAKVREENKRFVLSKGSDDNKEQSYVLWGLSQSALSRTIFPLGNLTKPHIKELAHASGFEHIAKKRESYDICFIPDDDYRSFLQFKIPNFNEKISSGDFKLTNGKIIGKHKGFPFYTIGQRKGLEVAIGTPLYVVQIIPETNTVILGKKDELSTNHMTVSNFNPIKYARIDEPKKVITKIRYKDVGSKSTIKQTKDNIDVYFSENVSAITPGQSAVFYEQDDVIGGGFIV